MYMQMKNVKFIMPHFSLSQPNQYAFDEPYVEITTRFSSDFVKLDATVLMLEHEYVDLVGKDKLEEKIREMVLSEF